MTEIKHRDDDKKGQFDVYCDGKHAGLLTYSWNSDDRFTINHTEVNEDFSGLGLGKKLVEAAVIFAREKGATINPTCPFAKSLIEKKADWQDIL